MAEIMPAYTPPLTPLAFYNQRWVQKELGVSSNYSYDGPFATELFFGVTGDPMIRTIGDIEDLLAAGLNLALVYGDRDYRCNCM